ncbi:MAG TPA: hypothetical protein VHH36_08970 [Candidatus Thermoplasmatota archaeon]|nr:hypothetical protein [Candidatus Thermoplasmatota archaeon]
MQVPVGDGEHEFGLAGAFLPGSHHDPLQNGYRVDAEATEGGFVFGSDVNGDGSVQQFADCHESHDTTSGNVTAPEFTTTCEAGADGGWWVFTKCSARAFPDSSLTTNGSLVRVDTEDADHDGLPNLAEDGDADGVPDLVNGRWDPQIGLGDPNPSVNCVVAGHAGTYGG